MNTKYPADIFFHKSTARNAFPKPLEATGAFHTISPLGYSKIYLPVPEKSNLKRAQKKKQKFRQSCEINVLVTSA
jgi:hypothetical protein